MDILKLSTSKLKNLMLYYYFEYPELIADFFIHLILEYFNPPCYCSAVRRVQSTCHATLSGYFNYLCHLHFNFLFMDLN